MELTNQIIPANAFSVKTGLDSFHEKIPSVSETANLNLAIYFNILTYMLCLRNSLVLLGLKQVTSLVVSKGTQKAMYSSGLKNNDKQSISSSFYLGLYYIHMYYNLSQ